MHDFAGINVLLSTLFSFLMCLLEEIPRVLYEFVDNIRTFWLGSNTAMFQELVPRFSKIDEGEYPPIMVIIGIFFTNEEALPR